MQQCHTVCHVAMLQLVQNFVYKEDRMKSTMKLSLLSLSVITLLSLSGCGGGGSDTPPAATNKLISGKAVDGYLAGSLVCYDLDHNLVCDSNEPNATTGANGDFDLTVTPAQASAADPLASLLVSGGTDIDTNEDYVGMLQAPYDGTQSINLTPLTTMASAIVANGGSIDEAYDNVASALGIPRALVDADPAAEAADGNTTLMEATMSVQRIVEVMAAATIADDANLSDANTTQTMNDIYAALGDAVADVASDSNSSGMAAIVQTAAADANTTLPDAAQTAADAADEIEDQVAGALANGYEPDDALAVDAGVNEIESDVLDAVDNNQTTVTVDTNASNTAAAEAALNAKIARIAIIASDVNATRNSAQTLYDVNASAVFDQIARDITTIEIIAMAYPMEVAIQNEFRDANSSRHHAEDLYTASLESLGFIVSADTEVAQAVSDVNESAAEAAQIVANREKTNMDTYLASATADAEAIAGHVTTIEGLRDGVNAAATALAISTAQSSAQGYLNTVSLAVEAVQTSATAARTAATTAQGVADANPYAQAYATATATAATEAETRVSAATTLLTEAQAAKNDADGATTVSAAETAAAAVQGKIAQATALADEVQAYKNTALGQLTLAQNASTTAPSTSERVTTLTTQATDVADVNAAKNMFAQLRETVVTFVDVENENNTSTILGSQFDTIETKIKPAVEAIADDFADSANALSSAFEAFGVDVENDFNATLSAINSRIDALLSQTDGYDYEQNWSVTAGSDTLSRTLSQSGTLDTEVFTFNGTILTIVTDVNTEGDRVPTSVSGSLLLSDTGYNINITSLSFVNNQAIVQVVGTVEGDNGATISLSGDVNLTVDLSVDNINMFQNPTIALDTNVTAGRRFFRGKVDVSVASTHLFGAFVSLPSEPNFRGSIDLGTNFNTLVDTVANKVESDVNSWNPLLMVEFSDGNKSFVTKYSESGNWDNKLWSFTTHDGSSVECNEVTTYNPHSQSHQVSCSNGETLHPYYTNSDEKITLILDDATEMIVGGTWTNWTGSENEVRIHIKHEDETYVNGAGQLEYDGQIITIADIRVETNVDEKSLTYDLEFNGELAHGTKSIEADFGIYRGVESEIFAEELLITDGTSSASAELLNIVMSNLNYMNMVTDNEDSYHYNGGYSRFESYILDYNNYNNADDNGFNPQNILELNVADVRLSLTDTDGTVLSVDGNLTYQNRTTTSSTFDGSYSYGTTTFVGHADADVTLTETNTTTEVIGTSNVSAEIASNGFEPFGINIMTTFSANHGVDSYAIFHRGVSYELGLHVVNMENNDSQTITTTIGDNNGVLGTMVYAEDEHGHSTNTGLVVKDVNGTDLATYGEDVNGNNWEIVYSNGDSETLF